MPGALGLASTISPFSTLEARDKERIRSSKLLQIGLDFGNGRAESVELCSDSRHGVLDLESIAAWRFDHAILLVLMQPLFHIFDDACAVASAALSTCCAEKWELAFRGEARSAFVWLQCLVGEERDWVRMADGGCFICQVQHTLSSESTIRAVMTAVLLSRTSDTPSNPRRLDFSPLLPALKNSLSADSFWSGPYHYDHFLSRAEQLKQAMRHLVQQTSDMVVSISLLARPSSPDLQSLTSLPHSVRRAGHHNHQQCRLNATAALNRRQRSTAAPLIKLCPSSLVQRQLQLRDEETRIMAELLQNWIEDEVKNLSEDRGKLESEATLPAAKRGTLTVPRRRVLTAPSGGSMHHRGSPFARIKK